MEDSVVVPDPQNPGGWAAVPATTLSKMLKVAPERARVAAMQEIVETQEDIYICTQRIITEALFDALDHGNLQIGFGLTLKDQIYMTIQRDQMRFVPIESLAD